MAKKSEVIKSVVEALPDGQIREINVDTHPDGKKAKAYVEGETGFLLDSPDAIASRVAEHWLGPNRMVFRERAFQYSEEV